MDLITEVTTRFAEERGTYKLLVEYTLISCIKFDIDYKNTMHTRQIVDSIIALFRCDYSGRGELAERQQKLGVMLNRLMKVSEEYNVAVYVTNQMCADPGGKEYSVNFDICESCW